MDRRPCEVRSRSFSGRKRISLPVHRARARPTAYDHGGTAGGPRALGARARRYSVAHLGGPHVDRQRGSGELLPGRMAAARSMGRELGRGAARRTGKERGASANPSSLEPRAWQMIYHAHRSHARGVCWPPIFVGVKTNGTDSWPSYAWSSRLTNSNPSDLVITPSCRSPWAYSIRSPGSFRSSLPLSGRAYSSISRLCSPLARAARTISKSAYRRLLHATSRMVGQSKRFAKEIATSYPRAFYARLPLPSSGRRGNHNGRV